MIRFFVTFRRPYSSLKYSITTKDIRKRFLEYFEKDNCHQIINSSPVVPFFDFAIPFVKCGAQQFKRVLTDEETFNYDNVVTTQRCVKVDGIYQSLNSYGKAPFNLSFFEMLGNWSFQSCDKKEACKLALNLLTSPPYSIPSNKLFVTYFSGNEELSLPADVEVREIWLELGVSSDHILPSRNHENLWNLGATGPWGTSSKIFVFLSDSDGIPSNLQQEKVPPALELYSIGFVKYNQTDYYLEALSPNKISTGMGLERLAAVLQNENSCYHTDEIRPLFQVIQKVTGAPMYKGTFKESHMDVTYRRLVDFSRLITISIADCAFPENNSRVKRVLQKALNISRTDFKQKEPDMLLIELSNHVAESFHDIFPEIGNNLKQVHLVIKKEQEIIEMLMNANENYWTSAQEEYPVLKTISLNEYPEVGNSFKDFMKRIDSKSDKIFPLEDVFNLCEKRGMDRLVLDKMADALRCTINWSEYDAYVRKMLPFTQKPKRPYTATEELILRLGIETDDSFKHNFVRNEKAFEKYEFPDIKARLLAIIDKKQLVSMDVEENLMPEDMRHIVNAEVDVRNKEIGLVFDKTNFTTEVSGSCHDVGFITFDKKATFIVQRVQKLKNYVTHFIEPLGDCGGCSTLKVGMEATLKIDPERRLKIAKNNTLSHVLLAVVRHFHPFAHFSSLIVNETHFRIRMNILQPVDDTSSMEFGKKVQEKIEELIKQNYAISIENYNNSFELMKAGVSLQPVLKYPYKNIRAIVLQGPDKSFNYSEASGCVCLSSTADIGPFYVLCLENRIFYGVTGSEVSEGLKLEEFIKSQINTMGNIEVDQIGSLNAEQILDMVDKLLPLHLRLKKQYDQTRYLFTNISVYYYEKIETLAKALITSVKSIPRETIVRNLQTKLKDMAERDKYAVHFSLIDIRQYNNLSMLVDVVYNNKFPSLVFCTHRGILKALCHVPMNCVSDDFNAGIWIRTVLERLGEDFPIQQEEEESNFCYMKGKKIPDYRMIDYVESFTVLANIVVSEKFNISTKSSEILLS